ncbi:MAG TPA: DUF4330 family protein [Clostridiales bacterium]|nr:DUF4330 family protein [Clostridiales bacterium]
MNNKGKLFGKLNIIDAVIIAIIILLLAFFAYRFIQGRNADYGNNSVPVAITFYHEEAPNYVVERLKIGNPVIDANGRINLGTISGFETGDSISFAETSDGEIKTTHKEGYCSLLLTSHAQGYLGPHGVTIGGTLYGVGHTMVIYAGDAKLYLTISDIQPVEQG